MKNTRLAKIINISPATSSEEDQQSESITPEKEIPIAAILALCPIFIDQFAINLDTAKFNN